MGENRRTKAGHALIAAALAALTIAACTPAHPPTTAAQPTGTEQIPLTCFSTPDHDCGPEYEADTGAFIGGYN